jgi:hypothetical protein
MRDVPLCSVTRRISGMALAPHLFAGGNTAVQVKADTLCILRSARTPSPGSRSRCTHHADASAALWWRHFHGYEPNACLDHPIRDGS